MESISLRGHVTADGTLELRVPTNLPESDVEVTVLVEPLTADEDLETSYRAMAADEAREREALEWSEGVIGDVARNEPSDSW